MYIVHMAYGTCAHEWVMLMMMHTMLHNICIRIGRYVWHGSLTCLTWRNVYNMCMNYFIRLTLLLEVHIHTCDITQIWDLLKNQIYVTWIMHMFEIIHSDVWHGSFRCDVAHSYVWHDPLMLHYAGSREFGELCDTYAWVMSHISMCHVAHINESCRTYQCVKSHISIGHVAHFNESCHTYQQVMSRISICHVTQMSSWCHTYEWIIPHNWMSHITRMNESCHTYWWFISHLWMSHETQQVAASTTSYIPVPGRHSHLTSHTWL